MFVRPESDLQYLSLVAKAAHEVEPPSVLLLLAPQSAVSSGCAFLVSGPSGELLCIDEPLSYVLNPSSTHHCVYPLDDFRSLGTYE